MDPQPPQTLGQFFRSYFKGVAYTLTHPITLLPMLLLTGIWIALGIIHTKLGESTALSILNFFTFAQGGLFGGVAGAIGGVLGKLLIATCINALVMPLFMKGSTPFARFGKGFKGVFGSFAFDSLRALSVFLAGMSLALFVYSFFNITQRWQESLVGITAAILLIRSIGQRGGLIFGLLFSILGSVSKGKTPSYIGIERFLSGMVIGMTVGVGLNAFGLRWCVVFALGTALLAFIFVFFGKKQQAALTAVSIAALLLVPLYAQNPPDKQDLMDILNQAQNLGEMSEGFTGSLSEIQDLAQSTEGSSPEAAAAKYQKMLRIAEGMDEDMSGMDVDGLLGQLGGLDLDSFNLDDYDEDGNPIGPVPDGSFNDQLNEMLSNMPKMGDNGSGQDAGNDDGEAEDASDRDFVDDMIEGWADEDSHVDDTDDASLIEGIGGVTIGLGGAGAAAGGAGGSGGGGNGGNGGNGGGPDMPDGSTPENGPETEPDPEADPEKKEEEENDDEEIEEEAGDEPEPQEEELEPEEEQQDSEEQEPQEGTDEDPQPGDEEGFEEEEEEEEEAEEEQEPQEGTDEDPQPGDEEGFEEEEEAEEELEEMSEEEYQEKMEEYERQVKELEEERAEREKQQAETDQRYKDAFDKDAEQYKTTSSEERIRKEAEEAEAKRQEKEQEEENRRLNEEQIQKTAERHGVDTKNEDGSDKDIQDLKKETQRQIAKDKYKGTLKDATEIQQLAGEEELEYSLLEADAAYIDEVSENSVNVLGEGVPGGRYVKNGHNFLKAVGKNVSEAYNKGESMSKAAAVGAVEGGISVMQNQAGDIKWAKYGGNLAKLGGEATAVIGGEGAKVLIHELANGTPPDEALNKALTATGQKVSYFAGSKVFGKLTGNLKQYAGFNKTLGKLISDGTGSLLTETTHNYYGAEKVGTMMESYENYRDAKVGELFSEQLK